MDKEVVRIEAMKCNGLLKPEYKRLCVDPQLTSFQVLRHLLAKAFSINDDFSLSYLSGERSGAAIYLSLLSDWDVNAAFAGFSDPHLKLKVDLRPFEPGLDDWDVVGSHDTANSRTSAASSGQTSILGSLTETISSQVGRTVSQVGRVMGLRQSDIDCDLVPPVCDALFHRCLDPAGHLSQPAAFRLAVYRAGLQPSLRRVAWRHLLDVFPEGLSGAERYAYLRNKSAEYHALCSAWQLQLSSGDPSIAEVVSLVREDVLRTDRTHIAQPSQQVALQSLLVTYAVCHPTISYRQGMSDLASPLLLVQGDEAHAYICLCALLARRAEYFTCASAMGTQMRHLAAIVRHHDPELHAYLASRRHGGDHDLEHEGHGLGSYHFCYRWLLLELKREFPLDDALRMLEVLWSSLPPLAPPGGVSLAERSTGSGDTAIANGVAEHDSPSTVDRTTMSSPSGDSSPLPGPAQLGGGNAMLLHACAAILTMHRETLLSAPPRDYDEVATYFDKLVRCHDVAAVLKRARSLYVAYLRHVTNSENVSV